CRLVPEGSRLCSLLSSLGFAASFCEMDLSPEAFASRPEPRSASALSRADDECSLPPRMDDEDDERPPPRPCCANARAAINATIAAAPSINLIFILLYSFVIALQLLCIVLRAERLAHVHPQIEGETAQIKRYAARIANFKARDRRRFKRHPRIEAIFPGQIISGRNGRGVKRVPAFALAADLAENLLAAEGNDLVARNAGI